MFHSESIDDIVLANSALISDLDLPAIQRCRPNQEDSHRYDSLHRLLCRKRRRSADVCCLGRAKIHSRPHRLRRPLLRRVLQHGNVASLL